MPPSIRATGTAGAGGGGGAPTGPVEKAFQEFLKNPSRTTEGRFYKAVKARVPSDTLFGGDPKAAAAFAREMRAVNQTLRAFKGARGVLGQVDRASGTSDREAAAAQKRIDREAAKSARETAGEQRRRDREAAAQQRQQEQEQRKQARAASQAQRQQDQQAAAQQRQAQQAQRQQQAQQAAQQRQAQQAQKQQQAQQAQLGRWNFQASQQLFSQQIRAARQQQGSGGSVNTGPLGSNPAYAAWQRGRMKQATQGAANLQYLMRVRQASQPPSAGGRIAGALLRHRGFGGGSLPGLLRLGGAGLAASAIPGGAIAGGALAAMAIAGEGVLLPGQIFNGINSIARPAIDYERGAYAIGRQGGFSGQSAGDALNPSLGSKDWERMRRAGLDVFGAQRSIQAYGIRSHGPEEMKDLAYDAFGMANLRPGLTGLGEFTAQTAHRQAAGYGFSVEDGGTIGGRVTPSSRGAGYSGAMSYLGQLEKVMAVAVEQGTDKAKVLGSIQDTMDRMAQQGTGLASKGVFDTFAQMLAGGGAGGRSGQSAMDMLQAEKSTGKNLYGNNIALSAVIGESVKYNGFKTADDIRRFVGNDQAWADMTGPQKMKLASALGFANGDKNIAGASDVVSDLTTELNPGRITDVIQGWAGRMTGNRPWATANFLRAGTGMTRDSAFTRLAGQASSLNTTNGGIGFNQTSEAYREAMRKAGVRPEIAEALIREGVDKNLNPLLGVAIMQHENSMQDMRYTGQTGPQDRFGGHALGSAVGPMQIVKSTRDMLRSAHPNLDTQIGDNAAAGLDLLGRALKQSGGDLQGAFRVFGSGNTTGIYHAGKPDQADMRGAANAMLRNFAQLRETTGPTSSEGVPLGPDGQPLSTQIPRAAQDTTQVGAKMTLFGASKWLHNVNSPLADAAIGAGSIMGWLGDKLGLSSAGSGGGSMDVLASMVHSTTGELDLFGQALTRATAALQRIGVAPGSAAPSPLQTPYHGLGNTLTPTPPPGFVGAMGSRSMGAVQ